MTYDQWKTTDPSQEGDVCPCGSGEWACRVYSKEYGVPPAYPRYRIHGNGPWSDLWGCEACEDIVIQDALNDDSACAHCRGERFVETEIGVLNCPYCNQPNQERPDDQSRNR
jgi:hypothetical protein